MGTVESEVEESVDDPEGAGASEGSPVLWRSGMGKVGGAFDGTRSGAGVTFTKNAGLVPGAVVAAIEVSCACCEV